MAQKREASRQDGTPAKRPRSPSMEDTLVELTSPFLRLPLELREQIYECLLPNTDIIPAFRNYEERRPFDDILFQPPAGENLSVTMTHMIQYVPLRKDKGSCHPEILRVNRQIYEEATRVINRHCKAEVLIRKSLGYQVSSQFHTLNVVRKGLDIERIRERLAYFRRLNIVIQDYMASCKLCSGWELTEQLDCKSMEIKWYKYMKVDP